MSDVLMRLKTLGAKKLCIMAIPFLVIFYVGDKLHWLYRFCRGPDELERIMVLLANVELAIKGPVISLDPTDILAGLIADITLILLLWYRKLNGKKFRAGQEYGSAKWGTAADIRPFMDPNPFNNILLTKTERMMLSGRPRNPKHARNKNVEVIGGSGSGKTRFYVKVNLMQLHSSYVVTDPKGTIFRVQNKVCKSLLRPLLCTLFIIHQAKEAQ